MDCVNCGSAESRVRDSRTTGGTVRRRRECAACGHRWSTVETSVASVGVWRAGVEQAVARLVDQLQNVGGTEAPADRRKVA